MVSEARARRIAGRIREEMALLFLREVTDPRLSMVTVTEVNVDKELAFASVYVTATDAEDRVEEILKALEGASSFFRRELARKIPLRSFPKLRFYWDASQERGARIDELLAMLDLNGENEEGPSES